MEEDSFLSPELAESLGLGADSYGENTTDLLITKKKKKASNKDEIKVTPAMRVEAKKMSKQQRKRHEQIEQQKEREKMRSTYLQTLKVNEISAKDQELMQSVASIGQQVTHKQVLINAYKKHKAGLPLTSQEMDILFEDGVTNVGPITTSSEGIAGPDVEQGQKDSRFVTKRKHLPVGTAVAEAEMADSNITNVFSASERKYARRSALQESLQRGGQTSTPGSEPMDCDRESEDESEGENVAAAAKQIAEKLGQTTAAPTFAPVVQTVAPSIIAKSAGSAASSSGFGASMLAQFSKLKGAVLSKEEAEANSAAGDRSLASWNMKLEETAASAPLRPNQTGLVAPPKAANAPVPAKVAARNDGSITINNNFVAELEESEMDRCDNTVPASSASSAAATAVTSGQAKAYVARLEPLPLSSAGMVCKPLVMPSTASVAADTSGYASTATDSNAAPRVWRRIRRSQNIQTLRMKLPICGLEQEITECIQNHDVVILCGETGSGKTTQVPQFLYEAGYTCSKRAQLQSNGSVAACDIDEDDNGGMIVITQPRRVAAVATAERVASELGCPINAAALAKPGATPSIVGYQIRHDSSTIVKKGDLEDSTNESTRIKFVTDGVLLKEITTDLLLRQYSVVILDEAHERNVNTDILIGLLSRALLLRKKQSIEEMAAWEKVPVTERAEYTLPIQPLKLVIMSATLRVHDFMQPKLFGSTISIASKEVQRPGTNKSKGKKGTAAINTTTAATRAYITANLSDPVNIPVITVESRQYTVNTHFARRTEINNYLEEVYKKTCAIHKKLPPGAVLVFLTGKREISYMHQRLNRALNGKKGKKRNRFSSVSTEIVSAKADLFGNVDHTNDSDGSDDDASDNETEEAEEAGGDNDDAGAGDADEPLAEYAEDDAIFDLVEEDEEERLTETSRNHFSGRHNNDENPATEAIMSPGSTISQSAASRIDRFAGITLEVDANDGDNRGLDADDADLRAKMLRDALGFVGSAVSTSGSTEEEKKPASLPTAASLREMNTGGELPPPKPNSYKGAIILQLHAMMSLKDQNKVFDKVKEGYRLIVLATNVAETSITIPGVRYVVDCGRVKEKVLNTTTGVSKFEVRWVSKASAEQRKGRAGRVGPGHVYRLYSSAFFDQHMTLHASPEILKTPLEDLILQMKSIGINNIESFPFPTSPDVGNMNSAINLLVNIGALHVPGSSNTAPSATGSATTSNAITNAFSFFSKKDQIAASSMIKANVITPLGRDLVKFPIHPRLAKILVRGFEQGGLNLLKYCVVMVSMLSEKSPFVTKVDQKRDNIGSDVCSASKRPRDVGSKGAKGKKRMKGAGDVDAKDDYQDSSDDSMDDSDDDLRVATAVGSKGATGGDGEPSLHLEYHVCGDAIARLQAFYAFLHIISLTLVRMSGATAMSNEDLAKLLLNPRLRKWAAEQTDVQVFCNQHSLHLPTLTRCLELFAQLIRLSVGLLSLGSSITNTADFLTLILAGNGAVRATSRSVVAALAASVNIIACQTSVPVLLAMFLPSEEGNSSAAVAKRNSSIQGHSKHFKGSGGSKAGKAARKSAGSSVDDMTMLRQVLLTGFCDCIAKRVPLELIKSIADNIASSTGQSATDNPRGNANSGVMSRRRKMTAYMSCNGAVDQLLYIHPHSSLYENDVVMASSVLPEYVVYADLLSNLRGDMTYMMCTSGITPSWIAQCTRDSRLFHYSPAVLSPSPHYNTTLDAVLCYISPTYGSYNWALPIVLVPMSECISQKYTGPTKKKKEEDRTVNTALVTIDANSGFRDLDESERWFLRCLLEAQFCLPDRLSTPDIDGLAFKQLFRADKLTLPCAAATTVPPPKKYKESLWGVLKLLVRHSITSKPSLMCYLNSYVDSGKDVNINTAPLVAALQCLFKPEFRQEYRQFWKNFN